MNLDTNNRCFEKFRLFFVLLFFFVNTVTSQQKICFGSTMRYSVDSYENFGRGSFGSTYHWRIQEVNFKGSISGYLSDRTNDILINWDNTPTGTYHLIVDEIDFNGCKGLSQILKVEILDLPPSNLSKQFLCINPLTKKFINPVVLDTKLSVSEYSFNWQFNGINKGNNTSIEVFDTGVYTIEIEDLNTKCKATYEVNVELSSPSISKIKVNNFLEENQSIVISIISGIGDYEYSIDGNNFQDSPVFDVSKGGVYSVIIRDKNGCSDENLQAHILTYPKFFTPNNDGHNDFWKIEGLTFKMKPMISIFDRYGKLLKEIRGEDIGWDGIFNGFNLPSDDYWFTVEYTNQEGISAIFKSHFSLIR